MSLLFFLISLRTTWMSRVGVERSTLHQRSPKITGWTLGLQTSRKEEEGGKRDMARLTMEKKDKTRMLLVGTAQNEN